MKLFTLTVAILCSFSMMAQNNEGTIVFEEKLRVEFGNSLQNIEDDGGQPVEGMDEIIKQLTANMGTSKKMLFFNSKEALYTDFNKEKSGDASWTSDDGTNEVQMMMMIPESKTYTNLENKKSVRQEDLFGKKFLVSGDNEPFGWKMTGNQEEILGYPCQEATFQKDDKITKAWFTSRIPVAAGPKGYGELPGMILKLDINDGQLMITAKEVNLKALEEGSIEVPTKGKKVTSEQYEKIAMEKSKEMEDLNGAGGGHRIEIRIEN